MKIMKTRQMQRAAMLKLQLLLGEGTGVLLQQLMLEQTEIFAWIEMMMGMEGEKEEHHEENEKEREEEHAVWMARKHIRGGEETRGTDDDEDSPDNAPCISCAAAPESSRLVLLLIAGVASSWTAFSSRASDPGAAGDAPFLAWISTCCCSFWLCFLFLSSPLSVEEEQSAEAGLEREIAEAEAEVDNVDESGEGSEPVVVEIGKVALRREDNEEGRKENAICSRRGMVVITGREGNPGRGGKMIVGRRRNRQRDFQAMLEK